MSEQMPEPRNPYLLNSQIEADYREAFNQGAKAQRELLEGWVSPDACSKLIIDGYRKGYRIGQLQLKKEDWRKVPSVEEFKRQFSWGQDIKGILDWESFLERIHRWLMEER